MMTHKEALEAATGAYYGVALGEDIDAPMEAAIRAYLDARGLVMVPREMTAEMRVSMGQAIFDAGFNDWQKGWAYAILAAPDPFK